MTTRIFSMKSPTIYCRDCGEQMQPHGNLSLGCICKRCKVVAEVYYRKMYSVKAI